MPLNVLSADQATTSPDQLWETAEARWLSALASEVPVRCGVVFRSAELPRSYDANQWRLARLPADMTPPEAISEVESAFSESGTRCSSVTLAPGAAAPQLVVHLQANGFVADQVEVLRLSGHRRSLAAGQGLSLIPARAMRAGYELIARSWVKEWKDDVVLDMAMAHLDDPSFEPMLVLLRGQVVATGGVLSVGQVGRIEGISVLPDFRGRGIGRWLMDALIDACARAAFKHVLIGVDPKNVAAKQLYATCGFTPAATVTTYFAPWTAVAVNKSRQA